MPAIETTPAVVPGEADLIRLLALVYRAVDWKTQGGKSVLDRWSGMLLVASRSDTVGELVNTLCTRLGVGNIPSDAVDLIAACQPLERALLDLVAAEHIPVAAAAYTKAKEKSR
jgi:hypothetical protein